MIARLLPILYYHHVGERSEPLGHRRLWTSQARFRQQMGYLAQKGYRCVRLREGGSLLEGKEPIPPRVAVLTFDDGYENFYEFACPVLRQYGFGATVFVVTEHVGGASRWDPGSAMPLMNWDQLRELTLQGIEIGSHTVNHERLTQLSTAAAKWELETSRRVLEQKLGVPVDALAYPYGDWNDSVEELARQTGYRRACSSIRGNRHAAAELHRLKRVPVDDFTDLFRLRRKLSSIYDLTCRLRRFGRRLRGH